jgi:hypothetical protein
MEKRDELGQSLPGIIHLETKAATQTQVIIQGEG